MAIRSKRITEISDHLKMAGHNLLCLREHIWFETDRMLDNVWNALCRAAVACEDNEALETIEHYRRLETESRNKIKLLRDQTI